MQWNLRMVAAQQDIWRCSDLRDALLAHGMDISTKKMLRLWSGQPVSIRLDDLDIICQTLACTPNDLFVVGAGDQDVQAARPSRATPANGRARLPARVPQRV